MLKTVIKPSQVVDYYTHLNTYYMMNKIKETYERPTTDLLVIRFEQGILVVSGARSASNGYDTNNYLGGLGDEDGD